MQEAVFSTLFFQPFSSIVINWQTQQFKGGDDKMHRQNVSYLKSMGLYK
ncbi:hypothetical protein D920_02943 [Enterococcus faecalis 13-SD-W-01]|nr:hypothetical protein D920_02943 [Enterococcus faecalis 13-SD-W-01]